MINKLKSLKSNKGFVKYFKNTSWLVGEKVLRLLIGLFVGAWVARYLEPERFGVFNYAQSFVGIFLVLSSLGLDGVVVRGLIHRNKSTQALLGTALSLKLIGSLITIGLLTVITGFSNNSSQTNLFVLIIASSTIFRSFNVIDFYFQAKVLSKYVVYSNTISLLLSSIAKVILILNDAPLIHFVYVVVFDSLVLAVGFIYFFIKKTNHSILRLKFDGTIAVTLLKDSWPLILSGLFISVYMKIDQVMIKEMISAEAVGQYAAAVRLSEMWCFVPVVVASSVFPAIINAKKQSKDLYYYRLQKLFDLMVWISISIALPMTFMSNWIVNLLYGTQYTHAGSVLMIHIWSGIFVFLGVASGKWFLTENLQMLSFWRTFYGMLINVVLNFLLIPKYGIQGAAVATLAANVMAAFIFDFFNQRTKDVFYMKLKAFVPIRKR